MRAWRVGILIFNQDTNWISREPVRDRGYISYFLLWSSAQLATHLTACISISAFL
jgi:hypothetical protein